MRFDVSFIIINMQMQIVMTNDWWAWVPFTESWGMAAQHYKLVKDVPSGPVLSSVDFPFSLSKACLTSSYSPAFVPLQHAHLHHWKRPLDSKCEQAVELWPSKLALLWCAIRFARTCLVSLIYILYIIFTVIRPIVYCYLLLIVTVI